MFFSISLAIVILWCGCIQINAQCTIKGCGIKDKISMQDNGDEILQLLNNLQLQFQNLANQIERQNICGPIPLLRDCSDIRASGQSTNGVYPVYVEHQQKLYNAKAFCDMTSTSRTSWLIFQKRKDGSVDFYRTWSEYATGFGDPNGEFWLGNEMLHLLTSRRKYKLRVELEDFEGNRRYAEYARFSIGSFDDNYRLNISGYSGDAGDSFSYNTGNQFSTRDADNDIWNADCAEWKHGGWWFGDCSDSSLNGKYHRVNYSETATSNGVYWHYWHGFLYSLKATEMKIAPSTGFI